MTDREIVEHISRLLTIAHSQAARMDRKGLEVMQAISKCEAEIMLHTEEDDDA